ncbi:uncharacterized protein J3R85_016442 [Psidium guajava]|nr:uncharacterized protein J3R85_016442 [Psidium guajava]
MATERDVVTVQAEVQLLSALLPRTASTTALPPFTWGLPFGRDDAHRRRATWLCRFLAELSG